ncbi:MAG: hypothetical protein ACI8XD_001180 [Thermoproteota archaeon]
MNPATKLLGPRCAVPASVPNCSRSAKTSRTADCFYSVPYRRRLGLAPLSTFIAIVIFQR